MTTSSKKIAKKTGRPTALVPDVVEKLEAGLKAGFTIEQACLYANIDKGTFYNRVKRDEVFSTKMEQAKLYTTFAAKRNVNKAIKDGSVHDAWKWLERRHPEEFAPVRDKVDINIDARKQYVVNLPSRSLDTPPQTSEGTKET